jgi:hypothetical protein
MNYYYSTSTICQSESTVRQCQHQTFIQGKSKTEPACGHDCTLFMTEDLEESERHHFFRLDRLSELTFFPPTRQQRFVQRNKIERLFLHCSVEYDALEHFLSTLSTMAWDILKGSEKSLVYS